MGEVYRARDTRLDRTVAIKILPAHLSDKPEARERVERGAKSISSLNHPNICQLYDVGQQDGTSYLVMEYLEGETLADRLRKGPLPLEQILKYGVEICEGLEKAPQRSRASGSEAGEHHADQGGSKADGRRAGEAGEDGAADIVGADADVGERAPPSFFRIRHFLYVARAPEIPPICSSHPWMRPQEK